MDQPKVKIVYNVTERAGRSYWNRVGIAFVNRDGSLNVRLESLPVSGEMQIRDQAPRDTAAIGSVVENSPGNGASTESEAALL
ncbi:MAG: hypothetical protein JW751_11615 [Polyangiaceae bacterium]|nr:hypothetical protein [Polyangiaceae bacterium]